MEKLIKAVGESVDRRWFLRMVGKLGMGAAAVAGVLLLPRQASAACRPVDGECSVTFKPAGKKGPNTVCIDCADAADFLAHHDVITDTCGNCC